MGTKRNLMVALWQVVTFAGAYMVARTMPAEPHSGKDGKLLLGTILMAAFGYASVRAEDMED